MKSTTAIILILISGGLYFTVISPQYAAIKSLRDKQGQYESVLANVSALEEKRDALLAKYKTIPAEEVDRLDKVLPDSVNTVDLARDFDLIAARYGITVKSVTATADAADNTSTIAPDSSGSSAAEAVVGPRPAAVPTLQKVKITMSFVGTYPNFKKFLTDLESSIRIADVTDLSFNASDNGLSEYTMSLTTYWLK